MEIQRTQNNQNKFQKSKVESLVLPDFKTYHKAIIIRPVCIGEKVIIDGQIFETGSRKWWKDIFLTRYKGSVMRKRVVFLTAPFAMPSSF